MICSFKVSLCLSKSSFRVKNSKKYRKIFSPNCFTKWSTVRSSSSVNLFAILKTKINACGPGEVIPMHLYISCCVFSFGSAVSNILGVSSMTFFLLNLTEDFCEQIRVIDFPESVDVKALNPRIEFEFPVVLFPDPFFFQEVLIWFLYPL